MKLGDSSSFTCFGVFQVEASYKEIVTPDVLRDEVHFVVLVRLAALLWPVAVAQIEAILTETSEHDDDDAT